MKKILGLDLGTTSIGWALVNEATEDGEQSSIIKLGVRVNPLTVDEQQNFEKGKSITTNADRTLKRSMRRSLQRYKLRRENLIEILKENGFISDETILSEDGSSKTASERYKINWQHFETLRLRAKAATEEITLEQFARVLLMINKKRGYKSSRKAKGQDEGQLIDGMEVAKKLYNENLTPAQLCLHLLQAGKKYLPDFYRSDLQAEFDKIWAKQAEFYPEILTNELKENLRGKNEKATWAICKENFKWQETDKVWNNDEGRNEEVIIEKTLVGMKREGNTQEQKIENFVWRDKALSDKMHPEQIAIILSKINSQINNSSGYLGAISDRSKELYFNKQTVGQYQMATLDKDKNKSLRNMVFYRQDYLDEFNTIWETQAKFHSELTDELKNEIRDVVIFYQRRLKSQKGLISFCEFESRKIEVEIDGKKKTKTVGSRVIPRSSPLFQEFKIWQRLNDIEVFPANEKNKKRKPNAQPLKQSDKELLFAELSIKEKLSKNQVLTLLDLQEFDMNFNSIDGNKTQYELFKAYKKIIELSEHEIGDDFSIETIEENFKHLGINTDILYFDYQLPLDEQPMYKLYHLLYSFEGDKSNSGVENLLNKLKELYGFEKEYAKILAGVEFQQDYGNLSAKAIRKILPLMKMGQDYATACSNIYERHSASSLTTEELEKKVYKNKLEILPKNSLRNPVVEKILNQMVNVVNSIIADPQLGKPDEIRIELTRDLKKNADERFLLTDNVNANTEEIKKIKEILKNEFGIDNASRNDVIRYKLWKELAPNGYKTLYSNTHIPPPYSQEEESVTTLYSNTKITKAMLFSKEVDIEHIIPQSRLFDDSFSNKTLELKSVNIEKGNKTAIDYVKEKYGESGLTDYLNRIIAIYGTKTSKKVFTNKATGNKSIKSETKTFDTLQKDYVKSLKKRQKEEWENLNESDRKLRIINKYFSNKLKKLVITENELPEGFIERDLGTTQYITKYAKTMLGDLVKFVVSTTGSITERLREDWQLVDVMKEINFQKYEQLGLVENEERIDYETGEVRYVKKIKDWTKRNDQRHHAMDALTVAFTKRQFIQYLNNLNARRTSEEQGISNTEKEEQDNFAITSEDIVLNTRDVLGIEKNYLYRDKRNKLRFNPPMPLNEFRAEAKKHLANTLISIKAKNKVVTQNINTTKKSGGTNKKVQQTPRGQLHNETIYGSYQKPVVKINKKTGEKQVSFETVYTIRKPISADLFKDSKKKDIFEKALSEKSNLSEKEINEVYNKTIDFILDKAIRTSIIEHYKKTKKKVEDYNKTVEKKDQKKVLETAFSNLGENPIWLNKEKGISIKRVTIYAPFQNNLVALHEKKDKDRNEILNKNGNTQGIDYVSTGNNHHAEIFKIPVKDKQENNVVDDNGNQQYEFKGVIISFFDSLARVNAGIPIIDKEYRDNDGVKVDDAEFLYSMKQNEYFVLPKIEKRERVNEETDEVAPEEVITFNPQDIDLLNPDNYHLISPNLFRIQKLDNPRTIWFRHHLETNVDCKPELKDIAYTRKVIGDLQGIVKVRVNHIGQIISVGEY